MEWMCRISRPCVVSITNISVQEVQSFFHRFGPNGSGQTQLEETVSCGSGVIIYSDEEADALYIVTNQHVVADAMTLSVSFVDNSVYEAQLCGTDEELDLAVLKVALTDLSEQTLEQIDVISIGDSDALEVGEQVVAIGNALGYGQSVTTGIVSALNRSITNEDGTTSSYIQTDAAINPGNSGGALLNLDGELIGINTAKLSSTDVEGMGYAIPISTAEPIIDDLMNRKTRTTVDEDKRGYLGISGVDVTSDISKQMGIPTGAYVAAVVDGSVADKAGLKKGDVITKFDGSGVSSMTSLKELMSYYEAGETVDITFKRADNGEYTEQTVQITLSDQSAVQQDSGSQNNGNAGRQGK